MPTSVTTTPVGAASGGKVYAYNNISTTPQVVAPANVNRVSLTFHNPGSGAVIIFPSVVQNVPGTAPTSVNGQPNISDVALTPTTTLLGGGLYVYPNGGQITIDGECSKAYQALALTGSTNPLTVVDNNVAH